MKAVELVNNYAFNEKTAAGGWGVMTAENWQSQIDTYASLGQFKSGPPKLEDVMTLDILAATADVRPKLG